MGTARRERLGSARVVRQWLADGLGSAVRGLLRARGRARKSSPEFGGAMKTPFSLASARGVAARCPLYLLLSIAMLGAAANAQAAGASDSRLLGLTQGK